MFIKSIANKYIVWNWDWNLDSALRYKYLVKFIRKFSPVVIVEVGSGSRGVSAYAKVASIGVDLAFDPGIESDLQKRVLASGNNLPFADSSIDVVLSVDMLEHVPKSVRPRIIKEMFRVVRSDGLLYIAVPVGGDAQKADRRVHDLFFKIKGKAHPMLLDHVEHGLPDKEEIVSLVDGIAATRGWKVTKSENTPIWLWEWNLMAFAVERWVPGLRHFQRILLQPFFPLLSKFKSNSNYRIILTATRSDNAN